MKCENCEANHNGSLGSGRFCSIKCSRSFSTKSKRSDINQKLSDALKQPDIELVCDNCKQPYKIAFRKRIGRKFCSKSCSSKVNGFESFRDKVNWSEINSQSYASGKNFVAGGRTKWLPYKDIKVQGTYELEACKKLDDLKESTLIKDWQYSVTRISYKDSSGKQRTYIVDFTVTQLDDSIKLVEVKGRQTDLDLLKWKAAKDQGYTLEVWTKSEIFN
jgi:hypothetical protein